MEKFTESHIAIAGREVRPAKLLRHSKAVLQPPHSRTMRRVGWSLENIIILFLLVAPCVPAYAADVSTGRPFAHPDRTRYDSQCLTIDGKDVFIYSGAFHFFRCPNELWPERFEKIKAAGFNTVETYVPWNWCEREMPASTNDFSKIDLKDFNDWLDMAERFGFYVIVRPGPYICAEWDDGGFPQWLLTKKPQQPLRTQGWLRSDDPVFLAWSKHWYDAVFPIIARHQITHKPAGQPGVILVQVENEYDFGLHFSDEAKENHLRALVNFARADGIDVPLISCWTHQIRGQTDPLLRQVFDCCNFYPRWKVDEILPDIEKLRREQPDAPLATTELQGGWFAKVGGKLSEDQEGVTALQINNLTLFTIQNGETMLSYYMLYGGSNPDDWAARDITSTYDYAAPIRECGGVGDKYQAVQAIGLMLQKYGADLARSQDAPCKARASQNDVQVAERRAENGGRYFFVRTSQHEQARQGKATVSEAAGGAQPIVFDYQLEPFGSKILYLPPGVSDPRRGEWLPKPVSTIQRPPASELPGDVIITTAKACADPGPAHWKKLIPGEALADAGVYDSHFIFYKTKVTCPVATNLLVTIPEGDSVVAIINGHLGRDPVGGNNSIFRLPAGVNKIELLYENHGFANGGIKMEQQGGIIRAGLTGKNAAAASGPMEAPLTRFGRPTGDDKKWWAPEFRDDHWRNAWIGVQQIFLNDSPLTWYRMHFSLPSPRAGIWVPWRLHLMAAGNGFVYLNGHPLGRYWQAGPQQDFYLPECWLKFGESSSNVLTLNLRPTAKGAWIQYAGVEPYEEFAEMRPLNR